MILHSLPGAHLLSLLLLSAGLAAAATPSPIADGYGSDGPYVGAFTTFTVDNPTVIGVTVDPVRIYVSSTAPAGRRPLLLLAHGYGGDMVQSALNGYLPLIYPDLVRFALGKGWTVVFVPYPETIEVTTQARYDVLWGGVQAAVADAAAGARIDTTRFGIIGHSFGGGSVPWLAWKATVEQGWGGNGAFAMLCAPWFEWRMDPTRMSQLPATMDVLMQVYDQDDKNDHEIAIHIYQSLPQPAARRDFVRLSGGSGPAADHAVPSSGGPNGSLNDFDWYTVYRALDGLADHAWNGVDAGRDTALGHGSAAQTAVPSPASLLSLWDAPVASQPATMTFPWSSRDTYQPPPTVTLTLPGADQVEGTVVSMSAIAAATASPDTLLERVTFSVAGVAVGTDGSDPYQATWTADGAGVFTVEAEAMDDNGRPATASATLTVIPAADETPIITPGTTTANQLTDQGFLRTYSLHVPAAAATDTSPRPLVLCLHGGGGTAAAQEEISGFSAKAESAGFLVAYPEGIADPSTGRRNFADGRGLNYTEAQGVSDVRFIAAMIDAIAAATPVDRLRVYSCGISNGGVMSQRLGEELSGRIAAIAPVAGNLAQPLAAGFRSAVPVAVLQFSGTDDQYMPYTGGEVLFNGTPMVPTLGYVTAAEEIVSLWVANNVCTTPPTITTDYATVAPAVPDDGCTVTRYQYATAPSANSGGDVVFMKIIGGGHTWPSGLKLIPTGGVVCYDLAGTDEMWSFFSAHPKRSPALVSEALATLQAAPGVVALSVSAVDDGGAGQLTYTWTLTGPGISSLPGNGTAAAHTLTATCFAAGSWTANVSITDADGLTITSQASFIVTDTATAPSITSQPANRTVTAGQTATFTVVAGGTAPLTYQWFKNDLIIAGATNADYTTPETTEADAGARFSVIVSNDVGSATSDDATLTVSADSGSTDGPGSGSGGGGCGLGSGLGLLLLVALSSLRIAPATRRRRSGGMGRGSCVTRWLAPSCPAGSGTGQA